MEKEIRYSPVFWRLYDAVASRARYVHSEGGARSGKTYSALQLLDLLVRTDGPGDVTTVCSESLPHLKRGCMRDFEANLGHPLKGEPGWNASDNVLTYPGGGKLEFFGVESYDRVLGPSRKRLFINEANHIPWETARQLMTRTSGLIIFDNNPEAPFWGNERIDTRDNAVRIHSTYKDNPFLPAGIVAEIEANRSDEQWWRVYGLGLMGQRSGLIYPDFEVIDELPEVGGSLSECYGLDFGFAVSYTAAVRVVIDATLRVLYVDQIAYDRGLLIGGVDEALAAGGVPRFGAPIYCDCARPDSIAELSALGWNAVPCDKSISVEEQIGKVQGWTLRITRRSVDVIREARTYAWKRDRDGNSLGVPVKIGDHAMDALRYALVTHTAGNESTISFEGDAFRPDEDPEFYEYNDHEIDILNAYDDEHIY